MEPVYGLNGRATFKPVRSVHGSTVRVMESTSIDVAQLWVFVAEPPSFGSPGGAETSACLTLETATVLRDQLSWLIDNHYMVKSC